MILKPNKLSNIIPHHIFEEHKKVAPCISLIIKDDSQIADIMVRKKEGSQKHYSLAIETND